MKFDSRNPFAAWGFEQEVYTKTADAPAFEGLKKDLGTEYYVNEGKAQIDENATVNAQQAFFTNNENAIDPALIRQRMKPGTDLPLDTDNIADNYNNAEQNYYGIEPQDLMADTHAKAKASSTNESNESESEETPAATSLTLE